MEILDSYLTLNGKKEYRVKLNDGSPVQITVDPHMKEIDVLAIAAKMVPPAPMLDEIRLIPVNADINPKIATKAYQYTIYSDTPLETGKEYALKINTVNLGVTK